MLSAIGIDLGGTNTKIALVSENGKIIKKDVLPTLNPFDKKEWVLQTDEVINDLKNSQRECNIAGIQTNLELAEKTIRELHNEGLSFDSIEYV